MLLCFCFVFFNWSPIHCLVPSCSSCLTWHLPDSRFVRGQKLAPWMFVGQFTGLLELLKWTFHYLQPHASWSQRTPTKHGTNPYNKMVGWKGFVERRKEVMVCVSKWENRGSFRGKHADYCIVKWLLIPLACFNPRTQQWLCLPPIAIEPLRSCVLPPSRAWLSIQSVY